MSAPTRESVIETIPDLVYAIDCEGRLLQWNRRLEEVTGLSAESLRGRAAVEFFAEYDRERVGAALEEALRQGFGGVEADLIQADGSVRPYQYNGVPLRDDNGAVIGLTGVGRDISQRRLVEKRTAALLEVARDTSGLLDLSELLARVQRRVAEMLPCDTTLILHRAVGEEAYRTLAHFGLPKAAVPMVEATPFPPIGPFGERIAGGECVIVDDASKSMPSMAAFAGVPLLVSPLRVRGRMFGMIAAARAAGKATYGADDARLLESVAHLLALAMETGDLYRAQQEEAQLAGALARVGQELMEGFASENLLQRLCRITVAELGCEASHTLLFVGSERVLAPKASHGIPTEAWESVRLLHFPADWFQPGRTRPQQILTRDIPHPSLQRLARTIGVQSVMVMPLLRGDEVIGFQTAGHRSEPSLFTPLQERVAAGIAQLASLALEHARTVEALERASSLKSEFVATMSHELRTPLNVILGYHALLLEGAWGTLSAEQHEVLQRAENSAGELLELITETLDLSRLESGRVTLDLAEVSLAALVADLEAETISLWERPDLTTRWEVSDQIPPLRTDPLKLKVVLKNLVTNALKFTEAGSVGLAAVRSGDGVEIAISDSGPGIPAAALAIIFDPFRQADGSTTRRHGGVGLGLYIVRRLLELLGGSVQVESEIGVGSTFRVRLPLRLEG